MFVYVMTSGDRCKIGISKAPRRRRSVLTTSNPDGVSLFYCTEAGPRALTMEKRAHALLSDFACSREWFRVHPKVAVSVVDHVTSGSPSAELIATILEWARLDAIPYKSNRYDGKRLHAVEDELTATWEHADEAILRL